MKNKASGFTLVELMITLAVSGVMLSIAVPSFQNIVLNSRITTETNRIISDIQLARSEAMKRSVRVILCRTGNPNAAVPSCGGTTNTWTSGWLVFASGDANTTFEPATDTLLKVSQAVQGVGLDIKTNANANNNLQINADATTNEGGNTARFVLCDSRGYQHGKLIEIPAVGRPRLADAVASCTLSS